MNAVRIIHSLWTSRCRRPARKNSEKYGTQVKIAIAGDLTPGKEPEI